MKMKWLKMLDHLVPLATQTNHPNLAGDAWRELRNMARKADMFGPGGPCKNVIWTSDAKVLDLLNELAAGSSGLAKQARVVLHRFNWESVEKEPKKHSWSEREDQAYCLGHQHGVAGQCRVSGNDLYKALRS